MYFIRVLDNKRNVIPKEALLVASIQALNRLKSNNTGLAITSPILIRVLLNLRNQSSKAVRFFIQIKNALDFSKNLKQR